MSSNFLIVSCLLWAGLCACTEQTYLVFSFVEQASSRFLTPHQNIKLPLHKPFSVFLRIVQSSGTIELGASHFCKYIRRGEAFR